MRVLLVLLFLIIPVNAADITLNPTAGNLLGVANPGPANDNITFDLSALDFACHFYDNEGFFTAFALMYPNRGMNATGTYQGFTTNRLGYAAWLDSPTVMSGRISFFAPGGGPVDGRTETPVFSFVFTTFGFATVNTDERLSFYVLPAEVPEPTSIVLLTLGLAGLLRKRLFR